MLVYIYRHKARILFSQIPLTLYKWGACTTIAIQASCLCLKHLPARYEVQSLMHHTYQALERCIVLPQRGKLFCRTTALHMWLQFEQQLKIWHQSRRCIICHLIMTHHWTALLIFPKVKNSNGICVIVSHLKSNPNVGCKREMRREMERATAACRTIQLCEREQNWLQWSCLFLFYIVAPLWNAERKLKATINRFVSLWYLLMFVFFKGKAGCIKQFQPFFSNSLTL